MGARGDEGKSGGGETILLRRGGRGGDLFGRFRRR